MSALDDVLNIGQDDDLVSGMFDLIPDAKFELAALRARVEQAERERDAARAGHDYVIEEQKKSMAYISELLAERDEARDKLRSLAHYTHCYQGEHANGCKYGDDTCPMKDIAERVIASATLTPRRCGTCCTEAAKAMREDISHAIDYIPIGMTKAQLWQMNADEICEALARIAFEYPLPSCDDCNPLKPEAAS